jgi:probable phosphoglycerate mutase
VTDDVETPEAVEGFRQHRYHPPPGATRVLLVRHGESAAAHPDRPFPLAGGHGDPPLHPNGIAQAEALGARLAATESIAAIYVTTLVRTHETAAPLAERIGLTPMVEGDLREVHLGEWEGGGLRVRAAAGDPIFAEVMQQRRWDRIPGAEPLDDFDARLQAGLGRIVAAHPGATVVAVVHGGVIGQLLGHAVGVDGFTFASVDNASISELVVHDGIQVLRRFNDTAHLEP